MRLIRVAMLSGLLGAMCLTMGMSGCRMDGTDDDLLILSVSRSTLFYWGHSTFSVTSADGHVLLFDPYNPQETGYPQYQVQPDVVLISHNHADHNDTTWSLGDPEIVNGLDDSGNVRDLDFTSGPFHITTVASKHYSDPADSALGNNAIFVVEVDGVRIAHLGDLGEATLDADQIAAIGEVDFLLIPVGGGETIDGATAVNIVDQLEPLCVLPMHYRTDATASPLSEQISTVDDFVADFPSDPTEIPQNGISLNYTLLGNEMTLLLIDYLP